MSAVDDVLAEVRARNSLRHMPIPFADAFPSLTSDAQKAAMVETLWAAFQEVCVEAARAERDAAMFNRQATGASDKCRELRAELKRTLTETESLRDRMVEAELRVAELTEEVRL